MEYGVEEDVGGSGGRLNGGGVEEGDGEGVGGSLDNRKIGSEGE